MEQVILYAIGLVIGLMISTILLISVTTRKKRSTENMVIRVIAANVLVAAVILILYPYHVSGFNNFNIVGTILWTSPVLLTLLLDAIALNRVFSGERPDQEILNAWHDNPANWKFGIFYYNPDDHRIFPPKRLEGFGWTINFANAYSVLVMTVVIVLISILFSYLGTIYS